MSCDEEFITQVDPNEPSTDSFWKNLDETDDTLLTAYATMFNHFVLSIMEESFRADMGWPGWGRTASPNFGDGKIFYFHTYTSSTGPIQNKWAALYEGIFRANQTIAALENLEGSVDEEARVSQMAQARFLRGLYHFYLHSSFNNGNVILRDAVPVTDADFNKPVSPSSEVLAFFRADLQYAYENLPATYDADNIGRATAGAAATILGTSFLYEEEYARALPLFNDVIDNPEYGYGLLNPRELFTIANEFSKESIFEIPYNKTNRPDINRWTEGRQTNRLPNLMGDNSSIMPAWIQYKYRNEPMDPLDDRNYYIDPVEGRKLRNVPLRGSQMVTLIEDEQTLFYMVTNTSEKMKQGGAGWGFGHTKKYSNFSHLENEGDNMPGGGWESGKNVIVNRLADVYLMRAEAKIKTGDITGALLDINTVRARWALQLLGPQVDATRTYDNINYTADSLMDHLMYTEKPLELSNEGHAIRWNDLRRWGITKSNFERLASEDYYAVNYTYTRVDGSQNTSDSALEIGPNEPAEFTLKVDFEYDEAAITYSPEKHDYYPIPLSEQSGNSNID